MKKTKSSNLTLNVAAPDAGRLTGADRILEGEVQQQQLWHDQRPLG